MAKEMQELEQDFIKTMPEKTGHDFAGWAAIIKATGLDKTNAIIKELKETHKLNHMQATFLTGMYFNDGKAVYDYEVLFQKLFDGKGAILPIYQTLEKQVRAQNDEIAFIPTRSYVSIEGARVFGCATLTKDNIRLGLDLGDMAFGDYVQKAKGLGAMPNITHMIELRSAGDVNADVIGYVDQAYRRVHKK